MNRDRQAIKTINVTGLPAALADALRTMTQALQAQPRTMPKPRRGKLPNWRGKAKGKLRRRDIYGDIA